MTDKQRLTDISISVFVFFAELFFTLIVLTAVVAIAFIVFFIGVECGSNPGIHEVCGWMLRGAGDG